MNLGHTNTPTVTLLDARDDSREHPAWADVELAIQTLDAGRRSELVMEAADGSLLTIGGGRGRFHVQYTSPAGLALGILVLVEPSRGTEVHDLLVGGVWTPLPTRLIVDEAAVLRAAAGFYRGCGADSALTWDEG